MTIIVRRPLLRVFIDGVEVGERLGARVTHSLYNRVAECHIEAPTLPSWATKKYSTVAVWMAAGYDWGAGPQYYCRFRGFYIGADRTFWPRSVSMQCYGPLILANKKNKTVGGTDLTGAGAGAHAHDMIAALLDDCGLTTAYLTSLGMARAIDGTDTTLLGTVAYDVDSNGDPTGPFTWRYGESAIDCIQRIDHACHRRTFETPGGVIVNRPFTTIPSQYASYLFQENANLFSAGAREDVQGIQNRITASGYGDPPVEYTASAANALVLDPTGYEEYAETVEMLEREADADPGDGLSCQTWVQQELIERNREKVDVGFSTPDGSLLAPGQTWYLVGAADAKGRLDRKENVLAVEVQTEISERGEFTQHCQVIGGDTSATPVDPPPLADFSMTCIVDDNLGSPIYVVYCRALSVGYAGTISSYAWTSTGGTPASGSEETFCSAFTDLTGADISLQVTDNHSQTGTCTKDVPAASSPEWVARKVTLAANTEMQVWDGAAWGTHTPSSGACVVAANGTYAANEAGILKTLDDLATPASKIDVFTTSDVTALFIEVDASDQRLLAGANDGRVAYSRDAGSTWSIVASPDANPVLRCIIDRNNPSHWYALTAVALYETADNGSTWGTVIAAGAGEAFTDFCLGYARGMVSMSGGRLLVTTGGTAQTIPVLMPPVSQIVAVVPDPVFDRFLCCDSDGRGLASDADGSDAIEYLSDTPAQVLARGLSHDGLCRGVVRMACGASGVYVAVDGFAATYYQVTGDTVFSVGSNGLLTAIP